MRDLPSPTGQKKGLRTLVEKHHETFYPHGSLSLPPEIVSNLDEDIKNTWDQTTQKPHNFTLKSSYWKMGALGLECRNDLPSLLLASCQLKDSVFREHRDALAEFNRALGMDSSTLWPLLLGGSKAQELHKAALGCFQLPCLSAYTRGGLRIGPDGLENSIHRSCVWAHSLCVYSSHVRSSVQWVHSKKASQCQKHQNGVLHIWGALFTYHEAMELAFFGTFTRLTPWKWLNIYHNLYALHPVLWMVHCVQLMRHCFSHITGKRTWCKRRTTVKENIEWQYSSCEAKVMWLQSSCEKCPLYVLSTL